MIEDDPPPYQIQEKDGLYRVVDQAGMVVCSCGGHLNAQQYTALLTQAYRRGYKLGYRQGRRNPDA